MVNDKDIMRKLKFFAGIAAAQMLWLYNNHKYVHDQ